MAKKKKSDSKLSPDIPKSKKTQPSEAPVSLVPEVISQEIVRLNVEVPEDLQDRLKIHAIKTKSTVKEIVQAVLEKNSPRYDG